jgi:hypothetical protein
LTITSTSYTTHSTLFFLALSLVFIMPVNIQLSKISIAPAINRTLALQTADSCRR